MKDDVAFFYNGISSLVHEWRVLHDKKFYYDRMEAELLRNVHSIEKGLSLREPRAGFGKEKIKKIMHYVEELKTANSNDYYEACCAGYDVLVSYKLFLEKCGHNNDFYREMDNFVCGYENGRSMLIAGVMHISKRDYNFHYDDIANFFETRHSVRDFSDKPVDDDTIRKALHLAKKAPSACNRQGVRVYIMSIGASEKFASIIGNVGGVESSTSRYILITGKLSSYRLDEQRQFVVSASIYAAYLSLAFHALSIGSCIIQRPVIWNKDWNKLRKQMKICDDEQLVCALAIGNLKEHFVVPRSYRYDESKTCRFIE